MESNRNKNRKTYAGGYTKITICIIYLLIQTNCCDDDDTDSIAITDKLTKDVIDVSLKVTALHVCKWLLG